MRRQSNCLLLLVLCFGCNDAAQQHQAEQAQRDAVAKNLKQIGQAMHASQTTDSALDSVATDAQVGAVGSSDVSPDEVATPEQTDTVADKKNSLPSNE